MMSEEMKNQQIEQKQIEEMAKVIMGAVSVTIQYVQAPANETEARIEAKALIAAGYRKQSDTAREIAEMLKAAKAVVKVHFEAYDELIENIAAQYGVEVD